MSQVTQIQLIYLYCNNEQITINDKNNNFIFKKFLIVIIMLLKIKLLFWSFNGYLFNVTV